MDGPVLQTIEFRLSYVDCDPAGIVYYAAYYPWFERCYSEWTFTNGFPPHAMREMWGATHISIASDCRYHVPAKLHDPLRVDMRLGHIGTTSFSKEFSVVHRETGTTMAVGHMVSVFVDGGDPPRPVPVPDQLRAILRDTGSDV